MSRKYSDASDYISGKIFQICVFFVCFLFGVYNGIHTRELVNLMGLDQVSVPDTSDYQ